MRDYRIRGRIRCRSLVNLVGRGERRQYPRAWVDALGRNQSGGRNESKLGDMTEIYVDGDACPVREEVYRVATRLRLNVFVVSNGSRPIRPPGISNVSMVLVGDSADAADDWIAERIAAVDVCVTSDIPLASRCIKKGARAVSPTGKAWTPANIGNALAGREIARHLRELGANTRGPASLTQKDRSRFLNVLDAAVQAALREPARS